MLEGVWNISSLALAWGTTYVSEFLVGTGCSFPLQDLQGIRPGVVSSFLLSSFPCDLTGFFCRNWKKKFWLHSVFTAQVFSISSEQELPCSCCAWVFHSSVFSCCTSQILGHTGSVIVAHWLNLPAASGVFPNQISNAYSKHPADRLLTTGLKGKSFWEGLRNQSLLHETWHYGLFLRRLIECCPLLQATSWDQDWFRFPSQVFLQHLEAVPAMWLCSYLSFWNPH